MGQNLMALQKQTVMRLNEDGSSEETPVSLVEADDHILVPAGVRIGVDGIIIDGQTEIDTSLITGESEPRPAGKGDKVYAGTLNLTGPMIITSTSAGEDSLLSEISALVDKAMEKRGTYVRLADRAASLYAPVVHLMALVTLLGWLAFGYGWQQALLTAIAVLIITCPCALGLAVPVVQVVATGSLFRQGILVNAGDAIERTAVVDRIVFDKTGTLTEPDPAIVNLDDISPDDLQVASRLAKSSHHILAKAVATHAGNSRPFEGVEEIAGQGVTVEVDGELLKLGSRQFCSAGDTHTEPDQGTATGQGQSELWFQRGTASPIPLYFRQDLKQDAKQVIDRLRKLGLEIEILSGDRHQAVQKTAETLQISDYQSEMKPQEKIAHIEALRAAGHQVMMVGDGLNDAAALQAANVSVAPASALDITQAAADIVVVGNRLAPLVDLVTTSRKGRRLIVENFFFAAGYNVVAVPLAVIGFVTPLLAALFMSGSSIVVTLNALRAQRAGKEG
jgi:Cu2+-exporting ATPase